MGNQEDPESPRGFSGSWSWGRTGPESLERRRWHKMAECGHFVPLASCPPNLAEMEKQKTKQTKKNPSENQTQNKPKRSVEGFQRLPSVVGTRGANWSRRSARERGTHSTKKQKTDQKPILDTPCATGKQ